MRRIGPGWRGWLASAFVLTVALSQVPTAWNAEPGPEAKPTLSVGSWDDVQKIVAGHQGRVVVVNVWTTTCGTCVAEFPKLVALREKFPADRVACLAVACDYDGIKEKPPEFYREKVLAFLKSKEAGRIENVLLNVPFVDFLEKIELQSTPAVLVYGSDGKLARRFDNDRAKKVADEFTMEQVVELVEQLVKGDAGTKSNE